MAASVRHLRAGSGERRDAEPAEAGPADRAEHVAAYIAEMTTELAELARGQKLELVAYLLEMARMEAASRCARDAGRSGAIT